MALYRSAIDRVHLPAKIRCERCNVNKEQKFYSKKRLGLLQAKVYEDERFNATATPYITCTTCTGSQVTELYCQGCDKTKGIKSFSKTRARDPDNAKCKACVEDDQNMSGPGSGCGSDNNDSDDDDDGGSTNRGGTFDVRDGQAGTTVTDKLDSLSITEASSQTGGVALAPSMPGSPYNSFKGVAPHLRKPVATTSSLAGSDVSSPGSKFAKVRAPPKKIESVAAQRERARTVAEEKDDIAVEESDSDSD